MPKKTCTDAGKVEPLSDPYQGQRKALTKGRLFALVFLTLHQPPLQVVGLCSVASSPDAVLYTGYTVIAHLRVSFLQLGAVCVYASQVACILRIVFVGNVFREGAVDQELIALARVAKGRLGRMVGRRRRGACMCIAKARGRWHAGGFGWRIGDLATLVQVVYGFA